VLNLERLCWVWQGVLCAQFREVMLSLARCAMCSN